MIEELPKNREGIPDIDGLSINGQPLSVDVSGWDAYRSWDEDQHHRFFAETIMSQSVPLAELLLEKRWSVVFSESDHFVTSDKPVALQNFRKSTFGVGTEGTIISFPLSPTRLLIMDDMHEEPANQYYPLMDSNRGAFNSDIWQFGNRFMITGRPMTAVLSEIVAWCERSAANRKDGEV